MNDFNSLHFIHKMFKKGIFSHTYYVTIEVYVWMIVVNYRIARRVIPMSNTNVYLEVKKFIRIFQFDIASN